jgi:hypothetical protein
LCREADSGRGRAPGAMEYSLLASRASSKERGGRMVGRRLASMVFPEPGGPTRSMFATVCGVRVDVVNVLRAAEVSGPAAIAAVPPGALPRRR